VDVGAVNEAGSPTWRLDEFDGRMPNTFIQRRQFAAMPLGERGENWG